MTDQILPLPHGMLFVFRQGGFNGVKSTVNFPIAFTNSCFDVVSSSEGTNAAAAQNYSYTKTSFYLYAQYGNTAHWVAFGI